MLDKTKVKVFLIADDKNEEQIRFQSDYLAAEGFANPQIVTTKEDLKPFVSTEYEQYVFVWGKFFVDFDLELFLLQNIDQIKIASTYNSEHSLAESEIYVDEQFFLSESSSFCNDPMLDCGIWSIPAAKIDVLARFDSKSKQNLLKTQKVKVIPCAGKVYDLNNELGQAENDVKAPRVPALFLDRDGVVIKDKKYLYEVDKLEFNSKIIELMQTFCEKKYPIFIITNQSGIAREIFSEDAYQNLTKAFLEILEEKNAKVDEIFHCPFHPDAKNSTYSRKSILRKPMPGMLQLACQKRRIDLSKSFMIGDKDSDVLRIEGPQYYLIKGDYPVSDQRAESIDDLEKICQQIQKRIN